MIRGNKNNNHTHVIQKVTVLSSPADLHDSGGDDGSLVVPTTRVHLECTTHALERVRVAAGFQSVAGYLQIFAHVMRIQYCVNAGHVHRFVGTRPALDQD